MEAGIQCELITPMAEPKQSKDGFIASDSDTTSQQSTETSEFHMSIDEPNSDSMSSQCSDSTIPDVSANRLLIIEEAKLMQLCQVCSNCGGRCLASLDSVIGTMVIITQCCGVCGKTFVFESQSRTGNIPIGNILTSTAIIMSGSMPTKALRMFKFMNVPNISLDTYMRHQKCYLHPAIMTKWSETQTQLLDTASMNGEKLVLGGDGRCNSPGHNAKYLSYTLMDLKKNQIVDVEMVQSNEVANSCGMEKEGLIRAIKVLELADVHVDTIVTDRHPQIMKWIRENLTDVKHEIDVWHVAKGLKKSA